MICCLYPVQAEYNQTTKQF